MFEFSLKNGLSKAPWHFWYTRKQFFYRSVIEQVEQVAWNKSSLLLKI
jgi:hypothetical protein